MIARFVLAACRLKHSIWILTRNTGPYRTARTRRSVQKYAGDERLREPTSSPQEGIVPTTRGTLLRLRHHVIFGETASCMAWQLVTFCSSSRRAANWHVSADRQATQARKRRAWLTLASWLLFFGGGDPGWPSKEMRHAAAALSQNAPQKCQHWHWQRIGIGCQCHTPSASVPMMRYAMRCRAKLRCASHTTWHLGSPACPRLPRQCSWGLLLLPLALQGHSQGLLLSKPDDDRYWCTLRMLYNTSSSSLSALAIVDGFPTQHVMTLPTVP